MARLPNGCIRMLCALFQFGSFVYAVNNPSPAMARTRRRDPFTALSNRFSSLSSSTRSCPETTTNGVPIMSSQKIGPSSLAIRVICWIGVLESTDSMLPTTGFFGGCGIGLSLFVDAIVMLTPCYFARTAVILRCAHLRASKDGRFCLLPHPSRLARKGSHLRMTTPVIVSPKSLPTPFDQLGADLIRLFLLRPMAAVPNQVLLEVGNDLLHAVGRGWRQHVIALGHDHQRRHAHGMVDPGRALPVARHVAVPVDAAGEAGFCKGIHEHLLFLRRQNRLARIVSG